MDLKRPSLYTYNLKVQTVLTEDRTLLHQYDFDYEIVRFAAESTDKAFLSRLMIVSEDYYEYHLPCYTFEPSSEFIEVYTSARKGGHLIKIPNWASHLFNSTKQTKPLPEPIEMNSIQKLQLKKAVDFCKRAGWPVDDYEILVVPHATGGLLALAEDGKIMLTQGVFDYGTKTVAAAIYEEFVHLRLKMIDNSRELQSHLFQQVISLQEQLLNEAL